MKHILSLTQILPMQPVHLSSEEIVGWVWTKLPVVRRGTAAGPAGGAVVVGGCSTGRVEG